MALQRIHNLLQLDCIKNGVLFSFDVKASHNKKWRDNIMKKTLLRVSTLLVAVFVLSFMTACSDDDDNGNGYDNGNGNGYESEYNGENGYYDENEDDE